MFPAVFASMRGGKTGSGREEKREGSLHGNPDGKGSGGCVSQGFLFFLIVLLSKSRYSAAAPGKWGDGRPGVGVGKRLCTGMEKENMGGKTAVR